MSLIGTILLAFGIGVAVGLAKYWGTLKQEWTTARQTESKASAERSDDRQTVCTVIDATPRLAGTSGFGKLRFYMTAIHRHYLKAISLRTELSDGRFLITTTHADFVKEELPPEILREAVPRATSVPALLKRHRDRVASAVERTNVTVVPIGTVEEFGQSFVHYQSTVRALREKIGYAFTDKEQQYFDETDPHQDADMARSMFEAMRAMESDGRKRAS